MLVLIFQGFEALARERLRADPDTASSWQESATDEKGGKDG
jgi:hypothetical protein